MADDFAANAGTTGYLPVNGTVQGRIDSAGDTDWFRLNLVAGGSYLFDIRMDNGSQGIINVWDETQHFIMYSNSPEAFNRYPLTAPYSPVAAHQYFVEVVGAQPAGYTVGVRSLSDDQANTTATALPLAVGGSVAARIDYATDKDYFRIAAVAGTTYTVKLAADAGQLPTAATISLVTDSGYDFDSYTQAAGTLTMTLRAPQTKDYYFFVGTGPGAALPTAVPYHVTMAATDQKAPDAVAAAGSVDGPAAMVFSEAILRGNGSVTLLDGAGAVVQTWDLASAAIGIDGNRLVVDPGHVVLPGSYTLRVSGITDLAGNAVNPNAAQQRFTVDSTQDGGHAAAGTGTVTGWSDNDTAVFAGRLQDYAIARAYPDFYDVTGAQGKTRLEYIERIMFTQSDDVVALSQKGQLGQAWRLYQAAFDRAPDKEGLGYWLLQQQKGLSLDDVAQNFLLSKEFTERYGVQTNAEFVNSLYHNVLHRDGDAGGFAFHVGTLDHGAARADVLSTFSESAENQAQVASLIGNGIVYTPFG